MGRYDGKRVLVTGGTSGIGLATAKLLLEHGARVLVTGRTKGGLESARRELGQQAIVLESNSGSLSDIEALAERAKLDLQHWTRSFSVPVKRVSPLLKV